MKWIPCYDISEVVLLSVTSGFNWVAKGTGRQANRQRAWDTTQKIMEYGAGISNSSVGSLLFHIHFTDIIHRLFLPFGMKTINTFYYNCWLRIFIENLTIFPDIYIILWHTNCKYNSRVSAISTILLVGEWRKWMPFYFSVRRNRFGQYKVLPARARVVCFSLHLSKIIIIPVRPKITVPISHVHHVNNHRIRKFIDFQIGNSKHFNKMNWLLTEHIYYY